jgi:hypothetical protein
MCPTVAAHSGARIAGVFGACLALIVICAACGKAPPPAPTEVVALERAALASTPDDAAWRDAPSFTAPLIVQDIVEPRLLEASTPEVRVQAMTDGQRVAFRLSWSDSTRNDVPGVARFADACAVQLPMSPGPDLPAPQMGENGRSVAITYWSAFWQTAVEGRPDSITALYPRAKVDHYPFEAPSLTHGADDQKAMALRYAPARAVGNPGVRRPGEAPVQDLIAEGPGTLTPLPETESQGGGSWKSGEWCVVLVRSLPRPLAEDNRTQVAFAIWDGSHREAGAQKMRSAWIPFSVAAPL